MSTNMISKELLLTVAEASARLHISKSKTYGLIGRRAIAHHRLGGKILIPLEDIEAYLVKTRVEAAETMSSSPPPPLKPLKYLSAE